MSAEAVIYLLDQYNNHMSPKDSVNTRVVYRGKK